MVCHTRGVLSWLSLCFSALCGLGVACALCALALVSCWPLAAGLSVLSGSLVVSGMPVRVLCLCATCVAACVCLSCLSVKMPSTSKRGGRGLGASGTGGWGGGRSSRNSMLSLNRSAAPGLSTSSSSSPTRISTERNSTPASAHRSPCYRPIRRISTNPLRPASGP